ncbi:1,2-epoxyphenylacetyl-CoA isomerase [compost metagenome]|jgi:2-(1,2-epoxy-1,2-dihydrophenyl)acetyl-CoA isomerase
MTKTDYDNLLFEVTDRCARVTLNRPARLNSFTEAMHADLADVLTYLEEGRSNAKVLVLTGAGRAFCAGQDLSEGQMSGDGEVDLGHTVDRLYGPLVRRLRALPIPVIAAVNGVAAGAGANMALACDIVMAAESAFFLQPFVKLNLLPDTGGMYLLPRLVGEARAMGLSLLGDRLSAVQAQSWGLIWKAVPDAAFASAVAAVVDQLKDGPPLAHAHIKRVIHVSLSNDLNEQLDLERDSMRELGQTRDYREGVSAFLEKRAPSFQGN